MRVAVWTDQFIDNFLNLLIGRGIGLIQVVEMLEVIEKDAPGFPARPKRPTLHMHTNAI